MPPPPTTVPTGEDFALLADPYRRELLAHCYRMLGSTHEAEDLVQETFLLAWRAYGDFEGRSSLRTWLYRIATRACLKALERGARRPMPSGLGGPSDDPEGPLEPRRYETPWLEPAPDALFGITPPADPAATVVSRDTVRLAFVAALQHLPPRQRAVLLLRDVLAWRAAEVAKLLDTTTASVNSSLQRARAQLAAVGPAEDKIDEPVDARQRELADRFAVAFENADMTGLVGLLTEGAALEMPPTPTWFAGATDVTRFLGTRLLRPGDTRMVPTAANGQPAFAMYMRAADGYAAHAIVVLTIATAGITGITMFHQPALFAGFDMPDTL